MTLKDQIKEHGPRIANQLEQLAVDYGEDVLRWAWETFKARCEAKVDERADEAKETLREATARRREHIRAGAKGDGHQ